MDIRKINRLLESVKGQLTEATAATVSVFITILMGALTRYDQALMAREQKRGSRGNIYRLAHYAGAVNDIRGDMHDMLERDDPEALEKLKQVIDKRLMLPPADRVIKQIDAWLQHGTLPKYK
jgi:hypothetical protein